MKLARFTVPGTSELRSGIVEGDRVTAFGDGEAVHEVLAGGVSPQLTDQSWSLEQVTLAAPVDPRSIYAVARNYEAHIDERGLERPKKPLVFVKVITSVAPPGGPVRRPSIVNELDYEGELAIVIGRAGGIGGFCVANDVSARDLQHSESQWTRAKGADTFCPFGPWITTADEVPDPEALQLRTWVNGDLRQDCSTSKLLFGCDAMLSFIAETCTLLPGDLVLTGTPSGVGNAMEPPQFLTPGDRVRVEIDGLGAIDHPIV